MFVFFVVLSTIPFVRSRRHLDITRVDGGGEDSRYRIDSITMAKRTSVQILKFHRL